MSNTELSNSKLKSKKSKRSSKISSKSTEKKVAASITESLATLGRAYGNNVSKLNVAKVSEKQQSALELREPWHSSSRTGSREYGDYFSWQASVTHLEAHRIDVINSKGIKHFICDYMAKLQKCQTFERGHRVTPFASIRIELLNKRCDEGSRTDVGDEVDSKNDLSISASKTIELIRKYKSGRSIDSDLQVSKKKRIDLVNNKKPNEQRFASNVSVARKSSSSKKNEKTVKEQTKKSEKSTINPNTMATNQELPNQMQTTPAKSDSVNNINQNLQNVEEKSSEKSVTPSLGSIKLSEQKDLFENVIESNNSENEPSRIADNEISTETLYRTDDLLETIKQTCLNYSKLVE